MDSFYYNLLNIGKEKITKDEYTNIIDKAVEEETQLSKEYNPNLDKLCIVISTNINAKLKELNIDSKIVNTKDLFDIYEHQFVISSYRDEDDNINYYLIDPTYIQFRHKDNDYEKIYPIDVLTSTDEGTKLAFNLIKKGYSKIDDNLLKKYVTSLIQEKDLHKIDNINISIEDIVLGRRHK